MEVPNRMKVYFDFEIIFCPVERPNRDYASQEEGSAGLMVGTIVFRPGSLYGEVPPERGAYFRLEVLNQ